MPGHSQHRLLLVDDDPRNLLALDALLEPGGHHLLHASDGAEAMAVFDSAAPDIVLCDLLMPGMDGVEVLGRIRAHPERNHTPVIMITAHTEHEQRLRALRAGADEFLEKPLDAAILTARLNTLLRLKQSRDELAARHEALVRLQGEQRELMEFIFRHLSQPMTGLAASVKWLETNRDADASATKPVFDELRDELQRVSSMIEDLSWVSRLESCTLPVRRSIVDINEIVAQAIDRATTAAADRDVQLDVDCREHIRLHADAILLARVLDNLLENALRYVPDTGRIRIEVRRDDGVELRVCNDGPEIATLERSRIFGKFVRGWTDPPRAGHPGLGLYFCLRAIHAHQGEIEVIDYPGWATCFCVWLPGARE